MFKEIMMNEEPLGIDKLKDSFDLLKNKNNCENKE